MKIYKYVYSSQTFSLFSICWLTFLVSISVGIVVLQGVLVNPPSAKMHCTSHRSPFMFRFCTSFTRLLLSGSQTRGHICTSRFHVSSGEQAASAASWELVTITHHIKSGCHWSQTSPSHPRFSMQTGESPIQFYLFLCTEFFYLSKIAKALVVQGASPRKSVAQNFM
jgi:hypothetical protein